MRAALSACAPLVLFLAKPDRLCMQVSPSDGSDVDPMGTLRKRIARIQESGLATPAQAYFDIATQKSPSIVLRDFSLEASPRVKQAMQDAVVSLLGNLPTLQFDEKVTTTGDRLGALMLQLQMTGYMLRNAEYVTALRDLLGIRTLSYDEIRRAFDRLDIDGSGDLDIGEVRKLLASLYDDASVPEYEVRAMMDLFDSNSDGRISWHEFSTALGAKEGGISVPVLAAAPSDDDALTPNVTGTVTVTLDDGKEIEMDAVAYMEGLRDEAENLRSELNSLQRASAKQDAEITSSLSAYVSQLPEDQLALLSRGISQEVQEAMQLVIKYILKVPESGGDVRDLERDDVVSLEQGQMRQLCFYQLVLGYRLRESEAKGEASERMGL